MDCSSLGSRVRFEMVMEFSGQLADAGTAGAKVSSDVSRLRADAPLSSGTSLFISGELKS